MNDIKVELICVGTELLLGNILNTNAKYISEKCAELGLSMYYQTVVGDNPERLKDTIYRALDRSDVIITSGGLGPTSDDLTKEIIAEALELKLVEDEVTMQRLYDIFERYHNSIGKITPNNFKQAMVPEGCTVLNNDHGTAPAILIEKDGKTVIMLPGPPKELIPLFEEYCVPYFQEKSGVTIYSEMVKLVGIGESAAAAEIEDLILNSVNPTVAPYAKYTEVHLRITARAEDEDTCKKLIEPVYKQIEDKLGKYIFTTNINETLEQVIVRKMTEKHLTLATAESCTGGLVSGRIVNAAGASAVLKEGFVTYSNEAKMATLGVSRETLEKYGAVSQQCAMEMAKGAALKAGTDYAISTTGIAGPDGGTDEKPVGLVYIGIYHGGKAEAFECHFGRSRDEIRERAVSRALDILRQNI